LAVRQQVAAVVAMARCIRIRPVRGCIGWWWWDPVYQPTADACAGFCVQNNADACEWYENGECYVEFGSSLLRRAWLLRLVGDGAA
jgi:hypothetical protein